MTHLKKVSMPPTPWFENAPWGKLMNSDPVIIPYKVENKWFTTLYGIITE